MDRLYVVCKVVDIASHFLLLSRKWVLVIVRFLGGGGTNGVFQGSWCDVFAPVLVGCGNVGTNDGEVLIFGLIADEFGHFDAYRSK